MGFHFQLGLVSLRKHRKVVYFWPGDAETPGGPSVKYEIVGHWSLQCLLSLKFCCFPGFMDEKKVDK